jgi:hypothetical protein
MTSVYEVVSLSVIYFPTDVGDLVCADSFMLAVVILHLTVTGYHFIGGFYDRVVS